MTSPTASSPPGFFDLIDRIGNWAFAKLVARMLVFMIFQMVFRLPALFVLHVAEGVMHRLDTARPLPAPTKPPPDTRDTPATDPLGEDLAYVA